MTDLASLAARTPYTCSSLESVLQQSKLHCRGEKEIRDINNFIAFMRKNYPELLIMKFSTVPNILGTSSASSCYCGVESRSRSSGYRRTSLKNIPEEELIPEEAPEQIAISPSAIPSRPYSPTSRKLTRVSL